MAAAPDSTGVDWMVTTDTQIGQLIEF